MDSFEPQATLRVTERLEALGLSAIYLPETDSTNSSLKELALAGSLGGPSLLYAREQRQGRGTRGRSWHMQPGRDLAFTLALPLPLDAEGGTLLPDPRLTLAAAGAVAVTLETRAPFEGCYALRWPNDVMCIPPGGKVCGILGESSGSWFFVGLGVNVNSRLAGAASGPTTGACSLRDVTGRRFELDELLVMLAGRLLEALDPRRGIEHWLREWSFRDVTPGLRYRLLREGEAREVEALGIDLASGGLWVSTGHAGRMLITSYQDLQRLV